MTKTLLYKYFEGNCSPVEEQEVSNYLKGDDLSLLHEYLDEVGHADGKEHSMSEKQSLELLHSIQGKINTEEVVRHIKNEIEQEAIFQPDIKLKEAKPRKLKTTWFINMQVAASFAVISMLAGSAYLFLRYYKTPKQDQQVASLWTTIRNSSTNVEKVQMVDGTSIWLNAYSSFSFDKAKYNVKNREVHITGEAFFDVSHNPNKPFIVRAGKLSTIVLGTAFNVEAYKNEKSIRVILVRGKVRVEAGKNKRFMKPGQLLKYSIGTNKLAMNDMETRDVNAWITGRLVFNGIPLTDALSRIEQLYHVSIIVPKRININNKRLNGTFERKAIDELLKKILFVYGLNYRKKGGEYIISR